MPKKRPLRAVILVLQLKYSDNSSYADNGMLIKDNELKLIWNNIKESKSYNNVIKKIWFLSLKLQFSFHT